MGMTARILGVIPARAGSKGVPRKNVRLVGGEPLVSWTWRAAAEVPAIDRLIVSTDDLEVAALARSAGIEVPFLRPPHLASDTASAFQVAEHALGWLECTEGYRPDFVLWLQPTSPLRTAEDIEGALALAERHPTYSSVMSVCETEHHPFWTFTVDEQGSLQYINEANRSTTRRQELPRTYRANGAIFLVKRDVLLAHEIFDPDPTRAYIMPVARSIDIDSPWDLYLADLVLKDRVGSCGADSAFQRS
jgi:CMP-N,N'-diacetyllegionaminic acid synthase